MDEILALTELLEEVEQEAIISLLNSASHQQLTEETQSLLNERIFFCQFFSKRLSEISNDLDLSTQHISNDSDEEV